MTDHIIHGKIDVPITEQQVLSWFIESLKEHVKDATGKERTLICAFGRMIGKSVPEIVKDANHIYPNNPITADEFRKWLPSFLSEYFKYITKSY